MTIIIPAYKPDEKLIALIQDLKNVTPSKIVVVNDGSGEEYTPVFKEVENLDCTLLVHPVNRGKGAALKTAFSYLKETVSPNEAICTADADGQHLPKDILRCLEASQRNPGTLIIGGRTFKGNVPARSRFGNTVSRWSFHLLMGTRVYDTQTGLRAFTADLLDAMLSVAGDRYEYEMEMLCYFARKKLPMKEIEIDTVYLEENKSSHFNVLRDAGRVYGILLRNALGRLFQIITFLFSSILAFLIDLVVYWLLFNFLFPLVTENLSLCALLSLLVARTLSSVANYAINRKLVFHNGDKKWKTFTLYCLLVVAVFFGNHFLNVLFLEICALHEIPSLILAQIICFPLSFLAQKYVVFPKGKK